MTNCSVLMAILQENRTETATKVQEVLTEYGCYIRVRLGLHDSGVDECANNGIIVLQLCGKDIPEKEIVEKLVRISGVKVKYMDLDF